MIHGYYRRPAIRIVMNPSATAGTTVVVQDDCCPYCGQTCGCMQIAIQRVEPLPDIDLRKRIRDDRTWLKWKQPPRSTRR